jgi:hypothetical protein
MGFQAFALGGVGCLDDRRDRGESSLGDDRVDDRVGGLKRERVWRR